MRAGPVRVMSATAGGTGSESSTFKDGPPLVGAALTGRCRPPAPFAAVPLAGSRSTCMP